ncbi:MAG: hypothetical protein ACLSVD_14720 [Eggerthellaceae bacterium]
MYKHGFDGIEAIRNFANRVAVDRFDERFWSPTRTASCPISPRRCAD